MSSSPLLFVSAATPQPDDKDDTKQPRRTLTKLTVSSTSSLSKSSEASVLKSQHNGTVYDKSAKRRALIEAAKQQCSVDDDTFDSHRRQPTSNNGGASRPFRCTLKIRFVRYISYKNHMRDMNIWESRFWLCCECVWIEYVKMMLLFDWKCLCGNKPDISDVWIALWMSFGNVGFHSIHLNYLTGFF